MADEISDSIFASTKQMLGLTPDDTSFDLEILLYINSTFATLNSLGIGPEEGYAIDSTSAKWDDYLNQGNGTPDLRMNSVKSFMYLSVRLIFDPPATSFALAAFQKQIDELSWRLNVERERTKWVDPNPQGSPYELVIDGGNALDG